MQTLTSKNTCQIFPSITMTETTVEENMVVEALTSLKDYDKNKSFSLDTPTMSETTPEEDMVAAILTSMKDYDEKKSPSLDASVKSVITMKSSSPENLVPPEIVDKAFTSKNSLQGQTTKHSNKIKRPPKDEAKPNTHKCPVCNDEFETGTALGGHMGKHKRENKSTDQSKKNSKKRSSRSPPRQEPPWWPSGDFSMAPTSVLPQPLLVQNQITPKSNGPALKKPMVELPLLDLLSSWVWTSNNEVHHGEEMGEEELDVKL
ncbi:hypothetical protein Drorol1_Dr00019079 [Drosera rotundifolia]